MNHYSFLSLFILVTLGFVTSTRSLIPAEIHLEKFSQTVFNQWKNGENEQAFTESFMEAFGRHRRKETKELKSNSSAILRHELDTFAYDFILSLTCKLDSINELLQSFTVDLGLTITQFVEYVVSQDNSDLQKVIDGLMKIQDLCQHSLQANGIDVAALGEKRVDLSSRNIGNITLKFIVGAFTESVTTFILGDNQISDISPLESLSTIEWLLIGSNQIIDVSPLASLSHLQCLYLNNNQIIDISPLASLSKLVTLNLRNNKVVDISPLASLSNLRGLELSKNQVVNITKLASLPSLKYLNLCESRIVDISFLTSFPALEELHLANNAIVDILPLTFLSNLYLLNIANNRITNISKLGSLSKLEMLYLSKNRIKNMSVLSSLKALRTLYISDDQISHFTALDSLPRYFNVKIDRVL